MELMIRGSLQECLVLQRRVPSIRLGPSQGWLPGRQAPLRVIFCRAWAAARSSFGDGAYSGFNDVLKTASFGAHGLRHDRFRCFVPRQSVVEDLPSSRGCADGSRSCCASLRLQNCPAPHSKASSHRFGQYLTKMRAVLFSWLALAVLGAAGPAMAAWGCPDGTSFSEGLCVSTSHPAASAVAASLRKAFRNGNLGALVAGVWQNGSAVVAGALGESLPGVPAQPDMRHRVGNVAASFLTVLFLQLVDEGKVSLDDPVTKYLPDLGVPDGDRMTLRMLASSTTGLEHFPVIDAFLNDWYANPFRTWDPRELVAYTFKVPRLFPNPGEGQHFADTNLVLLALALESATGQKVHDMITGRFIVPLGLSATISPWNPEIPGPVLHSFTNERNSAIWEEATFWNPQWNPWSGDVSSSQDDVRKWFETFGSGKLLPPALQKVLISNPRQNGKNRYYAMGIGVWGDWLFTNPGLQGLQGGAGKHLHADATMVFYNTFTQASDQNTHYPTELFVEISGLVGLPAPIPN
ncbi:beta-lactamase/transpeptidase-like protein [Hyaloraphidium curvatum]|nr:beta-lactamase/transpeptidase-like protein [Hyaloraphidium curvatum]